MEKSSELKVSKKQFLLTSLAVLSVLMGFLFLQVKLLNRRSYIYEQKIKTPLTNVTEQKIVYATVAIPDGKLWQEHDGSYGAEYDFTICNNTPYDFTGWTVEADSVPGYRIDSLWAGLYDFEYTEKMRVPFGVFNAKEFGKQTLTSRDAIIVKAPNENYNLSIAAGETISFGMIMYLPEGFMPDNFLLSGVKITGKHIYKIRSLKSFWVLIFLIVVNLVLLFITVAIERTVRREMAEYETRRKYYNEVIIQSFKTFANFVDSKDPYTRDHSLRVGIYAREIGRRLKRSEEEQENLYWEGLMHDVGKITINDSILKKPGKLTDEEFNVIKNHTLNGYKMLKDFSAMKDLKEIALRHHERYDGTGYPDHLSGKNIPFDALIIGVCDSFDAMNSDRCYRPRLPKDKIIAELQMGKGRQFEPELAEIMIQMIADGFIDKVDMGSSIKSGL